MGPRFVTRPPNPIVEEGDTVTIQCCVEGCSSLLLSRDFLPVGIVTCGGSIKVTVSRDLLIFFYFINPTHLGS